MLEHLNKYKILLASNSPRRQELLKGLDIFFEIKVLDKINENYPSTIKGKAIAKYLAEKKSEHYCLEENELLITADTIVIVEDKILGKPKSKEDAIAMIQLLSGKTHQVATGVCIRTSKTKVSFIDLSEVEFDILSDTEINYYIDKYKPYDKAGSYGIQEWIGYAKVKSIEGSYFNIMGLPTEKLYSALQKIN